MDSIFRRSRIVGTLTLTMLGLLAGEASAQTAPSSGYGSSPSASDASADIEVRQTRGPNRPLLLTGALMLAVPYATGVAVAATSPRPEDERLYIPVAGPWLDLANRPSCGAPSSSACTTETWNEIFLIGSGLVQGAGVIAMVGSLLFPQTKTDVKVREASAPVLRVAPVSPGRGAYGVGVVGTF